MTDSPDKRAFQAEIAELREVVAPRPGVVRGRIQPSQCFLVSREQAQVWQAPRHLSDPGGADSKRLDQTVAQASGASADESKQVVAGSASALSDGSASLATESKTTPTAAAAAALIGASGGSASPAASESKQPDSKQAVGNSSALSHGSASLPTAAAAAALTGASGGSASLAASASKQPVQTASTASLADADAESAPMDVRETMVPLSAPAQEAVARKIKILEYASALGHAAHAIAFHMVGFCHQGCQMSKAASGVYPRSVQEVGQCVTLLDKYPEFRKRILEMGQGHGYGWTRFADMWSHIEQRYYATVSRPWYDVWTPAVAVVGKLQSWWKSSAEDDDADDDYSRTSILKQEEREMLQFALEDLILHLPFALERPGMKTRARDGRKCGFVDEYDPCHDLVWTHEELPAIASASASGGARSTRASTAGAGAGAGARS